MLDSSRSGMTRSSSHPSSSIYGKDFLELVWENGPFLLEGGSSNRTQKTPFCIGYPMNPSHNDEEGARTTKRTRLSTSHSLLDQFPAQRDSGLSSSQSHQSNGQSSYQIKIMQSSQSKNSYKSNEEFPNLIRPVKDSKPTGGAQHQQQQQPITASNSHMCTYSSQQCFPSTPFKKPKIDSSQTPTTPTTNSQKQYLQGCDEQRTGPGKVNFSNFLIPAVFLKSTHNHHQNSARNVASSARVEEIEFKAAINNSINSSKALDQSAVIESSKQTTSLTANKWNQASLADQRSVEPPLDDEHSEAVGHNNSALGTHGFRGQCNNQTSAALKAKGKVNANLCNERASSSVYSLGASNDPNFGTRKYEETDDSAYLSDNDEEPENTVKEMPAREGNNRVKRSRNSEIHNLSERKRRDKINEKIRTLKELIPNCNKMDKASMLDDAIDYLKTLKLQLQIMTMGSGLCMPLMMLPAAAHHMNAAHPHLPQLMGAGMGFRPGTGIPCNPPQFPIPPLPGVTDNRLQMFGFSNQMPPIMPIPNAPFINPIIGNSSTQPPLMAPPLKSSAKSTTLDVSNPNN